MSIHNSDNSIVAVVAVDYVVLLPEFFYRYEVSEGLPQFKCNYKVATPVILKQLFIVRRY